jgi:hypothetical protein
VKAAQFQIAFPTQINLGGLAAQGLGPIWQRRVDRSATVVAQIGWETIALMISPTTPGR